MALYRIAGLFLEIESKGIRVQKELDAFCVEEKGHIPDIKIEFDRTGGNLNFLQFPTFEGKEILKNRYVTIYETTDSFYVTFFDATIIYGYKVFKTKRETVIYCADVDFNIFDTYSVEIGKEVPYIFNGPEMLVNAIRDSFLFHASFFGRIAIHSASIAYRDRAWLFSALSGVGKSTHVEMWKKAGFEFEYLNGDITMIYMEEGMPVAAGLPWCGTSKIYGDKGLPFGGILFIKRDGKDFVNQLSLAEATLEMVARNISPSWTRELMKMNIDNIKRIIPLCFSGELMCTPSVTAANVSKDSIDIYLDRNKKES